MATRQYTNWVVFNNFSTIFVVPEDAPDTLYYSSKNTIGMGGIIHVVNKTAKNISAPPVDTRPIIYKTEWYGVTSLVPFNISVKGIRLLNDTRIKIVEGYDSCKTGMSGEESANGVGLYNETTNTSEIFAITIEACWCIRWKHDRTALWPSPYRKAGQLFDLCSNYLQYIN